MNNNILVVDDESGIRDIIKQYLDFEGYTYKEACNGQEAVDMFFSDKYDLIIMDVMMPFLDGISALRIIRQNSNVPIILLTAKSEEYDKVFGFDLGADDYVVKPFSPKELMSRVKAVLKRTVIISPQNDVDSTYTFKGIFINANSHEVFIDGKMVNLTPKEFDLIFLLTSKKGKVFTRENLLHEIWGYEFYGDSRTVDTHIKMLRNNMGVYRELIKTIWGIGYRYDEE